MIISQHKAPPQNPITSHGLVEGSIERASLTASQAFEQDTGFSVSSFDGYTVFKA